jgi:myosin-crossreactive antigen
MKRVYRSALGRAIDMDQIRLANEEVIAVGNMKVNARGDELGPGGEVIRTRNEVMSEYYKLNTPMISSTPKLDVDEQSVHQRIQEIDQARPGPMRGSLAGSVVRDSQQKILDDQDGTE